MVPWYHWYRSVSNYEVVTIYWYGTSTHPEERAFEKDDEEGDGSCVLSLCEIPTTHVTKINVNNTELLYVKS